MLEPARRGIDEVQRFGVLWALSTQQIVSYSAVNSKFGGYIFDHSKVAETGSLWQSVKGSILHFIQISTISRSFSKPFLYIASPFFLFIELKASLLALPILNTIDISKFNI